ncbi:MAG: hypothetical protein AB7S48_03940 [Bacteroidales bacterium]
MSPTRSFFLFCILISVIGCVSKKHDSFNAFDFRSAKATMVSYGKSFGTFRNSTTTLWIDSYGEEISIIRQSIRDYSPLGLSVLEKNNTLDIIKGDSLFSINLSNQSGVVRSLGLGADSLYLSNLSFPILGKDLCRSGKCIGSDSVLMRPCKVYSLLDRKVWLYKGLILKTERKLLGETYTELVTSLEENCDVDPAVFAIPLNVDFHNNNNKYQTKSIKK